MSLLEWLLIIIEFLFLLRTLLLLAWLYLFYTVPLTFASSLVDKTLFERLFPVLSGTDVPDLITGFVTAMIWSVFFMILPQVFKVSMYMYHGAVGYIWLRKT
jgi:hypothetical protein